MSVQLLDKTRKINKLLHNNNSSKVVFNDICEVLTEILLSNVLVISRKGKILGVSECEGVEEITELISDKVGGFTRAEAENRLRSQMDTAEKARRANVVIPTDGTIEETAALIPPLYAAELAKEGSHGKHTASQTK